MHVVPCLLHEYGDWLAEENFGAESAFYGYCARAGTSSTIDALFIYYNLVTFVTVVDVVWLRSMHVDMRRISGCANCDPD